MALMEGPNFCSREEYEQGRNLRIHCGDLLVGELYTFMATDYDQRIQIKTPSRILEVTANIAGIYVVRLVALDNDLNEYCKVKGEFNDGLLFNELDEELEPGEPPLDEAYFKDYNDGLFEFYLEYELQRGNNLVLQ